MELLSVTSHKGRQNFVIGNTIALPFTVHCHLQAGRSGLRFPMVSMDYFIDIILPAALWPCG
jgi:hypothetical protein